tara:strand:- start:946 stop:1323 length:378 start_codon:yes stop_codon:yes gene_type:complete
MNKFKNYLLFFISYAFLILQPLIVKADFLSGLNTAAGGAGLPMGGGNKLEDYIVKIINGLLSLVGLIFVIMIILGGFKWMTAQGNADKVREAKDMIKNSIIGITVVLLSYTIVYAVYNIITTGQT